MSTFEKTLAREDFTRGNLFQTAKPGTLIRLRGHIQKSAAHPVWLSVHFSRLDMLTPCTDQRSCARTCIQVQLLELFQRDTDPLKYNKLLCEWFLVTIQ